jgi:hypothetical protein
VKKLASAEPEPAPELVAGLPDAAAEPVAGLLVYQQSELASIVGATLHLVRTENADEFADNEVHARMIPW